MSSFPLRIVLIPQNGYLCTCLASDVARKPFQPFVKALPRGCTRALDVPGQMTKEIREIAMLLSPLES